jgi:hypothetical protein
MHRAKAWTSAASDQRLNQKPKQNPALGKATSMVLEKANMRRLGKAQSLKIEMSLSFSFPDNKEVKVYVKHHSHTILLTCFRQICAHTATLSHPLCRLQLFLTS